MTTKKSALATAVVAGMAGVAALSGGDPLSQGALDEQWYALDGEEWTNGRGQRCRIIAEDGPTGRNVLYINVDVPKVSPTMMPRASIYSTYRARVRAGTFKGTLRDYCVGYIGENNER